MRRSMVAGPANGRTTSRTNAVAGPSKSSSKPKVKTPVLAAPNDNRTSSTPQDLLRDISPDVRQEILSDNRERSVARGKKRRIHDDEDEDENKSDTSMYFKFFDFNNSSILRDLFHPERESHTSDRESSVARGKRRRIYEDEQEEDEDENRNDTSMHFKSSISRILREYFLPGQDFQEARNHRESSVARGKRREIYEDDREEDQNENTNNISMNPNSFEFKVSRILRIFFLPERDSDASLNRRESSVARGKRRMIYEDEQANEGTGFE